MINENIKNMPTKEELYKRLIKAMKKYGRYRVKLEYGDGDKEEEKQKKIKKENKFIKGFKKNIDKILNKKIEIKVKNKKYKKVLPKRNIVLNKIKGYIPKYNVIINEQDDYILMLKVIEPEIINNFVLNFKKIYSNELLVCNYSGQYYISLKIKKYDNLKQQFEIIKILTGKLWKTKGIKVLKMGEILELLKEKTELRENEKVEKERDVYINDKNDKTMFQNAISQTDVKIKDDCILFNEKKGGITKHKVFGIQMFPSIIYNGFTYELNKIDNVETTSYIGIINAKELREKTDINKENIDIIEKNDELYNVNVFIHIFGDSDEEIKKNENKVSKIASKYHVLLNNLVSQQVQAFNAFLPIFNNNIKIFRIIDKNNLIGIIPYNKEINEKMVDVRYGYEVISEKGLFYKRQESGAIISSSNNEKKKFIEKEQKKTKCVIKEYRFSDECKEAKELNFNINKMNNEQKIMMAKMQFILYLSAYENFIGLENDDNSKKILEKIIDEIKIKDGQKYEDICNKILNAIKKNNAKMYSKIKVKYDEPDIRIKEYMNTIYEIIMNEVISKGQSIYVYGIEKIIDCVDILIRYMFKQKRNNIYMFVSENDFKILDNKDVAREIFNAPFLNIVNVKPNELAKINLYMELSMEDISNLNDNTQKTGMLLTNEMEYNYKEKKEG